MRILAKNLTYIYNRKTTFATKALDNVNITIEEGEFFGIIGQTGSGKSTFLQHLNALIPVMEGELFVGSYNLADKKCNKRELRSKVGMVFQYPEYQLFSDSVYSDVAFGLKNFRPEISKEEQEQYVRAAIEIVGLNYDEVKSKSPFDLSGGQKRRVAIAGVIVCKPEILVLDEPAAGLDPQGKKEIMQLLHKLHKTVCKTIVFVSHDMNEIAENCTKVAVFNNGTVLYVTTPKELYKKVDNLKELGLDAPVTAELAQKLKENNFDIDCDFTANDFIEKFIKLCKDKKEK